MTEQPPKLIWGVPDELRLNKQGKLAPEQTKRILTISIFDPWLRLLVGTFFLAFALTQSINSWQFWLPTAMALFPLGSAVNGLRARRRLRHATVEMLEGVLDDVKTQRSEAIVATLHRQRLFMLLLDDYQKRPLPAVGVAYRFWVIFGVIRPGIVVAIEKQTTPTAGG